MGREVPLVAGATRGISSSSLMYEIDGRELFFSTTPLSAVSAPARIERRDAKQERRQWIRREPCRDRVLTSPSATWTDSASSRVRRSKQRGFGVQRARAGATEEERARRWHIPFLVRVRIFFYPKHRSIQMLSHPQLSGVVDPQSDGQIFFGLRG
jgi:hypothetical protein